MMGFMKNTAAVYCVLLFAICRMFIHVETINVRRHSRRCTGCRRLQSCCSDHVCRYNCPEKSWCSNNTDCGAGECCNSDGRCEEGNCKALAIWIEVLMGIGSIVVVVAVVVCCCKTWKFWVRILEMILECFNSIFQCLC